MRIELTLNEDPDEKHKVYWRAKAIHRVDKESPEQVVMEVVSNSFIPGLDKEYLDWYERVTVRVMKELKKVRMGQGILRRMFLMEEQLNK